jgi:hypothetical protein
MYLSLSYTAAPLKNGFQQSVKEAAREGDNEEANPDVGVRLCDGNGNVFSGFNARGSFTASCRRLNLDAETAMWC